MDERVKRYGHVLFPSFNLKNLTFRFKKNNAIKKSQVNILAQQSQHKSTFENFFRKSASVLYGWTSELLFSMVLLIKKDFILPSNIYPLCLALSGIKHVKL